MAKSSEPTAPESYEAEYALESPLTCPKCDKVVSSLLVLRLLRSKVNFTSTLPRRGHVIVCPECRGILSAELGGNL
ncbi:MAG TPA: hypothetical protein VGR38_03100 [Candidatus Polarisedimenticolia bacterium]|jgi:hypothetical protein|nr:hypothetical protein [Candidatus Polarisedimenticolia bacterium]